MSTETRTKITIKDNGSIRVEGDFEICDAEGKPFDLGERRRYHYADAA